MARANERGSQHGLTFRIEGMPSETTVSVEISRFLPRAQIAMSRSIACVQVAGQFPNTPMSIRSFRLLPQRVDIDLSSAPDVLTLQLLLNCDDPFLFGWLRVPGAARTTLISPVETLSLYGPGYWAAPMWEPTLRGPRELSAESVSHPQPSSARLAARTVGKSIAAAAPNVSARRAAPVVSSKTNDETRETKA